MCRANNARAYAYMNSDLGKYIVILIVEIFLTEKKKKEINIKHKDADF